MCMGLNELIIWYCKNRTHLAAMHCPWGYAPLKNSTVLCKYAKKIMDYRRGCSSLLEELLLLLLSHSLWMLLFFLHYFFARSSLFLLVFLGFPWITGQQVVSFNMTKVMTCVALHVAKIWSKRIKYPISHAIYIPCMQCASPPLVRIVISCLMNKHIILISTTIKSTIILVDQSPWLLKLLQSLDWIYTFCSYSWIQHVQDCGGCNTPFSSKEWRGFDSFEILQICNDLLLEKNIF